jgi:hypothetical protein
MSNTVFQLRRSTTTGSSPNNTVLASGELAINVTDKKLFSSNGTASFQIGGPAGTNTQIQYNSNGQFAAVSNLTYDFANNILYTTGNVSIGNQINFTPTHPTSPSNGSVWFDNTHNTIVCSQSNVVQSMVGVIFVGGNTFMTLNSSSSNTPFFSTNNAFGTNVIPANSLTPGKVIRILSAGLLNTANTASGNITINMYLGGTLISNTNGPIQLTSGLSNVGAAFNATYTILATGNTATGLAVASASFSYGVDSSFGIAPGPPVAIDTTVNNAVVITGTVTNGPATGNVTFYQAIIELLG